MVGGAEVIGAGAAEVVGAWVVGSSEVGDAEELVGAEEVVGGAEVVGSSLSSPASSGSSHMPSRVKAMSSSRPISGQVQGLRRRGAGWSRSAGWSMSAADRACSECPA